MVNRHQWRQSLGRWVKIAILRGFFGPSTSLKGRMSRRCGHLRERRVSAIAGSVAEPLWVYRSSRLE